VTVTMAVVVENMTFFISRIEAVRQPSHASTDQAGSLEKLSEYYRTRAIAGLLARLDRTAFQEDLTHSARARLQQLKQPAGAVPGYYQRASRLEPFFDALAAGQDELAEEIARLSPAQYLEGEEFEEEFCYARVLFALIAMAPVPQSGEGDLLEPPLSALETVLDGNLPRRLALCTALAERDATAFHVALVDVIEERDLSFQKRRLTLISDMERNATEEAVFVEGLAFLRLAARIGITSPESYRFMPDLARADR